ncbi:MAG: hypothetical protein NXI25_08355 [bacterium]|nr:hypothetical protein [bacterium]
MMNFKVFDLSISSLALRFYFMMAVIVTLGFLNQWILAIVLGFLVGISFTIGISVHLAKPEQLALSEERAKLRLMDKEAKALNAA